MFKAGSTQSGFKGAAIGTGSAKSCTGLKQAIIKSQNHKPEVRKSNFASKFGNAVFKSQGVFKLVLLSFSGKYISFESDVVDADVSLLLGLDLMSREGFIIDIKNLMVHVNGSKIPLHIA